MKEINNYEGIGNEELSELMGQGLSEVVKQATRRLIQEALAAEVREALGRDPYERGAGGRGYRNGIRRGHVKTAEGRIDFDIPQVREVPGGFRSAVRKGLPKRSEELTDLAVEMYARGLSTRDIEATFRDESGRSLLSKSAVSEITEVLWEEYQAFCTRSLEELEIVYLFVDGVAERLHSATKREAVLVAWGIDGRGEKHLLSMLPGTKESTENVEEFLHDLLRRGLSIPALIITDGAPGLIRGVETVFPQAWRQRCLAHKIRNIVGKVPESEVAEVKAEVLGAYQAPNVLLAEYAKEAFLAKYTARFPSAVRCFEEDFEACIAHLRFPPRHRKYIRTTNMLERLFEEERRRTKINPSTWGEKPVLKLSFAALSRASASWRKMPMSELEQKQLQKIIEDKKTKLTNLTKSNLNQTTPSASLISSKSKT